MVELFFQENFSFQNPEAFWLLLLLPVLVFWHWHRVRTGRLPAVVFSSVKELVKTGHQAIWLQLGRYMPLGLRILALSFLIVALARPRLENQRQTVYAEGIDIMMVIDLSGSMLAEDFEPKNRIEAAKEVAIDFINHRISDRIGLVVFAGQSYTQCPLTLDYNLLKTLIAKLEAGQLAEDGTAIGLAIATAANRLRDSQAKSKVIILLTDGQNNAGEIEPITAAELAAALGIKIYTVGAGTQGYANYPFEDPLFGKRYMRVKVDVDDATLTRIADLTGGRYFRATDYESLKKIYREIDALEKTKVEVETFTEYKEEFVRFLTPALLCLALEVLLINTRWRRVP
ncbi:MAG: VWA domain-containing protein [Chloroherpetonaceae bacterium]|nr:VWA domain-containing protein [Chloroherpetonaceae bacterium]